MAALAAAGTTASRTGTRLPPGWANLPSNEAEYEFARSRRAAQLQRAQEQLAALREHAALQRSGPDGNAIVLTGPADAIGPAHLLVPRESVIAMSETCPDGWEPHVNADGEPLYFPFALLDEEKPGAGVYHSSLLAACRKP